MEDELSIIPLLRPVDVRRKSELSAVWLALASRWVQWMSHPMSICDELKERGSTLQEQLLVAGAHWPLHLLVRFLAARWAVH